MATPAASPPGSAPTAPQRVVLGGYREPDATVVVEHDKLRVTAVPLTRSHDSVQVLDNAKNMYFSKAHIVAPESGEVSVELGIRAQRVAPLPHRLRQVRRDAALFLRR